jgi:molecular chaperone GrpE
LEKFVGELLPVYDSLERGLDSIKGDDEHAVAMREGMDMTKKLFLKTIEKFGVSMVEPLDQPFNPELHQAMTMQESAEHEPNTVMNVFQPGFLLNGRLIRPAMVVVAREPAPKIDERA